MHLPAPLNIQLTAYRGRRCRARCRKRKTCRFYTSYSTGLCALSSRCGNVGHDRRAETYAKVPG